jgi:hypothetical protein
MRSTFPIRYLGLPLTVHRLKRADFQFIEDKLAAKLSTINGNNITMAGRLSLVKSVISSQLIYPLTALRLPIGLIEKAEKIEREFLWTGTDKVSGGK